jgi:hypothetical protein
VSAKHRESVYNCELELKTLLDLNMWLDCSISQLEQYPSTTTIKWPFQYVLEEVLQYTFIQFNEVFEFSMYHATFDVIFSFFMSRLSW